MPNEHSHDVDPSWLGVIKWGGLFLVASAVVLVIFVLLVLGLQQELPVTAYEALEDPATPTLLFILTSFGELFLLPGGLALYFALKRVNKTAMFLATAIWVIAPVMFLVSRGLIISLSQLSDSYLDAAGVGLRSAYLAAAELALEAQNIYAIMALVCLNVASIVIGSVMLKSAFGRLGYLVILAGFLTLFTPFGVIIDLPIIIPFMGLILTAVWQLTAGVKLYKLGRGAWFS